MTRKQQMQALADEYRMYLREAESANECGNLGGLIRFGLKMAANVSRRIVLTYVREVG